MRSSRCLTNRYSIQNLQSRCWKNRWSPAREEQGNCRKGISASDDEEQEKEWIPVALAALKACSSAADIESGKRIHSHAPASAFRSIYVANTLISMYAKCGSMPEAQAVFDSIDSRDVVSWNALITGYTVNGEDERALNLFLRLGAEEGAGEPNARTFMAALMACASLAGKEEGFLVGKKAVKLKCLEQGMQIHSQIARRGCGSDIFLSSTLVDMYAKCGSLEDARAIFNTMPHHNVVSWTALITGYAENGEGNLALELFGKMQREGCAPNARTFVAAFTACSSLISKDMNRNCKKKTEEVLQVGRTIHAQAAKHGFDTDNYVGNSLVDMYGKLGSLKDAQIAFGKMVRRDVISWNALMLGCAENGENQLALETFDSMKDQGCEPNARSFVAALMACSSLAGNSRHCLRRGLEIHHEAAKRGCDSDMFVANSLINMYAKCGSMEEARAVFSRMVRRNVVSWTGIVQGYVENGEFELALQFFASMECLPDARTYVAALMACAGLAAKEEGIQVSGKVVKLGALERGLEVHSQAVSGGYISDVFLTSSLIDMYAKCGSLVDSRAVFDKMANHDVVAWTALLLGYAENGEAEMALELFEEMRREGCAPNALTFISALTACVSLAAREEPKLVEGKFVITDCLEKGRIIHRQAQSCGLDSEILVANTLIDMYAKCGSMKDASSVFHSMDSHTVVSWTVLILGYVENFENERALQSYEAMRSVEEDCSPDARTFVAALMACANLAAAEEGKLVDGSVMKIECLKKGAAIHGEAAKAGFQDDMFVANSLVVMYAKCGSLDSAREVFDKMARRNVVSWTAMIQGYAESDQGKLALELFKLMRSERYGSVEADARTYVAAIVACGTIAALDSGREIHAEARARGFDTDVFVGNSLVDFFGRCGSMSEASAVFELMPERNLVSWSALIGGYAREGSTERVFGTLDRMLREGKLQPNGITFLSVLTTCSHAGLVEKGKEYFEMMQTKFRIEPEIEHYHCMIDLLGRANLIDEAVKMAKEMPFAATVVTWTTVLGACEKWKDVRAGKLAFDELVRLDEKHPVGYVLMGNIYGSVEMRLKSGQVND